MGIEIISPTVIDRPLGRGGASLYEPPAFPSIATLTDRYTALDFLAYDDGTRIASWESKQTANSFSERAANKGPTVVDLGLENGVKGLRFTKANSEGMTRALVTDNPANSPCVMIVGRLADGVTTGDHPLFGGASYEVWTAYFLPASTRFHNITQHSSNESGNGYTVALATMQQLALWEMNHTAADHLALRNRAGMTIWGDGVNYNAAMKWSQVGFSYRRSSVLHYLDGIITELLWFSSSPSAADRNAVYAWCQEVYGIG